MKQIFSYVHATPLSDQEPDTQPGDYFVSVRDGTLYALLSGPYPNNHPAALAAVERCKHLALDIDPKAAFYGFGTCRLDLNSGRVGLLQKHRLLSTP